MTSAESGAVPVVVQGRSGCYPYRIGGQRTYWLVLPLGHGWLMINGMNSSRMALPITSGENRWHTEFLKLHCSKVVIQEIPTRRYLGNAGYWAKDIAMATPFDSRSAALAAAARLKLRNVQLVLTRELKEVEIVRIHQRTQASPAAMAGPVREFRCGDLSRG